MIIELTKSEAGVLLRALELFQRCHVGTQPCTASEVAGRLWRMLEQPEPVEEEVVVGKGIIGSGV